MEYRIVGWGCSSECACGKDSTVIVENTDTLDYWECCNDCSNLPGIRDEIAEVFARVLGE